MATRRQRGEAPPIGYFGGKVTPHTREERCDGWHPGGGPCCAWSGRPTFAEEADLNVYWPDVRPCWEDESVYKRGERRQ